MLENGTVIRIEGPYIFMEMAGGDCKGCLAKRFCTGEEKRIIQIENRIGARVGDRLILEMPKRSFYRALSLIFLLPIIVLTGGFFLLNLLFSESVSGLIALSFVILWFLTLAALDKRIPNYITIYHDKNT